MGASIYEAPRLSPSATVTQSQVTGLTSALADKAVLTGGNNLNGTQTITGSIDMYSGTVTVRDNSDIASITLTGSTGVGVFTGGLGSTSLNGSNIGSGTVPAARLPATVVTTDTTQTISATKTFSGTVDVATTNYRVRLTPQQILTDVNGGTENTSQKVLSVTKGSGTETVSITQGGIVTAYSIVATVALSAPSLSMISSSAAANPLTVGTQFGGQTQSVNIGGDYNSGSGFGVVRANSGKSLVIGANNGTHLTLDTSGNATFAATVKPASYTVATLPTVGTGRIAYASNGRKNGEGAGSGTGVLVFDDGTAWRAVDTGATVAA